jgi:hypothetical protein
VDLEDRWLAGSVDRLELAAQVEPPQRDLQAARELQAMMIEQAAAIRIQIALGGRAEPCLDLRGDRLEGRVGRRAPRHVGSMHGSQETFHDRTAPARTERAGVTAAA